MDATVHGEKTITEILGMEPLASIPYMENKAEFAARRGRKKHLLIGGCLALTIALIIFHLAVMPLDVFWYKLLRVLGI